MENKKILRKLYANKCLKLDKINSLKDTINQN